MSEKNWIKIEMLYRDAGNWKTWEDHYYANKTGITVEQLEKALKGVGGGEGGPIVVQYYGMKSIAPFGPGEDSYGGTGDDHWFCEVTGFEAVDLDTVIKECRPHAEMNPDGPLFNIDIEVIYNKMLNDPEAYDINRIYKEGAKYCNE